MLERTNYSVDLDSLIKAKEWNFLDKKAVLNESTGNFFYDRWTLKQEYVGTVWEELLNALPFEKGEARVIVLQPGETYMAHADIDDRWHLNISGDQSFLIDLTVNRMWHLRPDTFWYSMDAGKIHVASNFGSVPRLQLVVRQLLRNCSLADQTHVKIEPAYEQFDYRYKFDNIISPWLNKMNKHGALSNFTFKNDVVEFNMATVVITMTNEISKDCFKITYE